MPRRWPLKTGLEDSLHVLYEDLDRRPIADPVRAYFLPNGVVANVVAELLERNDGLLDYRYKIYGVGSRLSHPVSQNRFLKFKAAGLSRSDRGVRYILLRLLAAEDVNDPTLLFMAPISEYRGAAYTEAEEERDA